MATLIPNNGTPLKNREYAAFQNFPTRRERRAALRDIKRKLKKHVEAKIRQGIKIPNGA
jgi:hypothetical protein